MGYAHEGTKRQAVLWKGDWVDAHLMAILGKDWYERVGDAMQSSRPLATSGPAP